MGTENVTYGEVFNWGDKIATRNPEFFGIYLLEK